MTKLSDLTGLEDSYHIVIAIINGIGDAFLALPLIRYACRLFGEDRVTIWGSKRFARTVYAELGSAFVPTIETAKRDATANKEEEFIALRRCIPEERTICWVSLNSYSPTMVEHYAVEQLKPKYHWHHNLPGIRRDRPGGRQFHRADQYFRVIGEPALLPNISRRPKIGVVENSVARQLRLEASSLSKYLVAIHAETGLHKMWPLQNWIDLGEALAHSAQFVVLGKDGQILMQHRAFVAVGEAWHVQTAVVANAHFFVGIDSCFAHVADACEIPGVVLFANTDVTVGEMIDQWGPKSRNLISVSSPNGDLKELHVDNVVEILRSVGLRAYDATA
jgi:hypothetical protein